MSSKKIEWIIFDLGGVLVELIGVPTMLEWTGNTMTVEELWRRWLESPSVRAFERGASSPEEFAKSMVSEFSLPVNDKEFLEAFVTWPKGMYPGVVEMLSDLRSSYKIGSFSNTNQLHWEQFVRKNGIDRMFDMNFPSHKTGLLKPDIDAFENVVRHLACHPWQVMFIDDNQINVDSGLEAGMEALRISGPDELSGWFKGICR